jgi:hypothetical protein
MRMNAAKEDTTAVGDLLLSPTPVVEIRPRYWRSRSDSNRTWARTVLDHQEPS